jgi:homogentisate 1,2-dioxygenase
MHMLMKQGLHDEHVCQKSVMLVVRRAVHRRICTFQEKSMNQKTMFNAPGDVVVIINAGHAELFVVICHLIFTRLNMSLLRRTDDA